MDGGLCGLGMANYLCFRYEPTMTIAPEHGMVYNHSFAAYFIVQSPMNNAQLVNNVTNAITWTKGANDGIFGFDLEMTRMSVDGLYLIARNG